MTQSISKPSRHWERAGGGTENNLTLTISQRKRRKDQNMDWRVMLTTFGIIFLAEMGDKTQIAAMTMAAEKKRPWEVFIAASLALTAVSAIGVVVGSTLSHLLPLEWIKRVAGAPFIVIGVLGVFGKILARIKAHTC